MPFDPKFALSTMLPLQEAAYDLTKLPPGWTLIGTIQPDDFGFVARRGNVVIVVFRGTERAIEWLRDFEAIPVSSRYLPQRFTVHLGFQDQYGLLRNSVLSLLNSCLREGDELWIEGHSLGGVLAVQCGADAVIIAKHPLVYSWAGPRFGWSGFADWFSKSVECYSIENVWDEVPHTPPHIEWCSQGTRILIDGGKPSELEGTKEYLSAAHSLEVSYGPGVQKLITQPA